MVRIIIIEIISGKFKNWTERLGVRGNSRWDVVTQINEIS